MKCPLCETGNVELEPEKPSGWIKDGNIVWQCPNHSDHRFWKNMRELNVLHQDPKCTDRDGTMIRTWKFEIVKTYIFTEITK